MSTSALAVFRPRLCVRHRTFDLESIAQIAFAYLDAADVWESCGSVSREAEGRVRHYLRCVIATTFASVRISALRNPDDNTISWLVVSLFKHVNRDSEYIDVARALEDFGMTFTHKQLVPIEFQRHTSVMGHDMVDGGFCPASADGEAYVCAHKRFEPPIWKVIPWPRLPLITHFLENPQTEEPDLRLIIRGHTVTSRVYVVIWALLAFGTVRGLKSYRLSDALWRTENAHRRDQDGVGLRNEAVAAATIVRDRLTRKPYSSI